MWLLWARLYLIIISEKNIYQRYLFGMQSRCQWPISNCLYFKKNTLITQLTWTKNVTEWKSEILVYLVICILLSWRVFTGGSQPLCQGTVLFQQVPSKCAARLYNTNCNEFFPILGLYYTVLVCPKKCLLISVCHKRTTKGWEPLVYTKAIPFSDATNFISIVVLKLKH